MKIYLAARYFRRLELCGYRDDLEALGHVVTSRWLYGDHQILDEGLSDPAMQALRESFALEDLTDVIEANALIAFTEQPRATNSRGGRHVEFGAALGRNLHCYVVGPRENVFHCLPMVMQFDDWRQALRHFRSTSQGG